VERSDEVARLLVDAARRAAAAVHRSRLRRRTSAPGG
jgi:GAF domain-containing protein